MRGKLDIREISHKTGTELLVDCMLNKFSDR